MTDHSHQRRSPCCVAEAERWLAEYRPAPAPAGLDENPCCYSLHEFEQVCPRTGTTFYGAATRPAEDAGKRP